MWFVMSVIGIKLPNLNVLGYNYGITSHINRFEVTEDYHQTIFKLFQRYKLGKTTNNCSWF